MTGRHAPPPDGRHEHETTVAVKGPRGGWTTFAGPLRLTG